MVRICRMERCQLGCAQAWASVGCDHMSSKAFQREQERLLALARGRLWGSPGPLRCSWCRSAGPFPWPGSWRRRQNRVSTAAPPLLWGRADSMSPSLRTWSDLCFSLDTGKREGQGLGLHQRADGGGARLPCPPVWRQHTRWVCAGLGVGVGAGAGGQTLPSQRPVTLVTGVSPGLGHKIGF